MKTSGIGNPQQQPRHAVRSDGGSHPLHDAMRDCIAACTHCHQVCLATLAAISESDLVAEAGAAALPSPALLLACSNLCALSASLQVMHSPYSKRVCALCADICRECEAQCAERIVTVECAAACRACAASCSAMSA
ncbi:hypothetical protein [Herbaspirillum autotrophicum]|uniref:hypothetical protein n=1 Tax=Herbaspirillum autotrophicum TaxID=180195 RepID=UPI00067C4199|nr:hypothetical protein [Herbaspirillum autotrophicum]